MSIHANNTRTSGIDMTAANALVATGAITIDDLDHALEANRESELLAIAHPDPEDQALHHANCCDGACLRFRCFRV